MSALTNYVTLTITLSSVGVTRAGFGMPLILALTAAFPERVRFYTDLAAVALDFTDPLSAEYLAAQAAFNQTPRPPVIAIGRSALKPTLVAQLSAVTPTANVAYTYKVTVRGKGFATTTLTFTSDGTPTDAEYAAAMVSALNGVASKNYTAAGSTSPVTITGNAAGDWFSIEVENINTQTVRYTHADPGVATDLTAISLEQPSWYALITLANSQAYGVAAAGWVESSGKIYLCDSCDSTSCTTAIGNGDLLDTIRLNAYTRTAGWYHPSTASMLCAAIAGRCLPLEPGAVTFFGKSLAGLAPAPLTATHRTNLVARRAGSYEAVDGTGLSVTFGGSVGSAVMGFLDVRRNLDWLNDDMTKSVFEAIVENDVLPFTDPGIGIIENKVRGSLTRAARKGVLAAPPGKNDVTVPRAADISNADKAIRRLPDVRFNAVTSGAIHSVAIAGRLA